MRQDDVQAVARHAVESRSAFIAAALIFEKKLPAASTARNVRATSTRHIASTPTSTGDAA
jgi:hypothetical protein